MNVDALSHSWDLSPRDAVQLKKILRQKIRIEPYRSRLRYIGGATISFNRFSSIAYAGLVTLDMDTLEVLDRAHAILDAKFPHVPGLLSFRQIPSLLEAWDNLHLKPDVMVFDGHGITYPGRLGVASHAGLVLDWPTIGCARSLLAGVRPKLIDTAGATADLIDRETHEKIGLVYRTKDRVKPVLVSPGHRMDVDSAFKILSMTVRGYRIPEPTRQAHLYVNQIKKGH